MCKPHPTVYRCESTYAKTPDSPVYVPNQNALPPDDPAAPHFMKGMSQNFRSLAGFLLKFAIAGGILAWLLSRMDVTRLWSAVKTANTTDVATAAFLGLCSLPIVGWRWQQLLHMYGVRLPIPVLMATVHAGQLFGLILPGSLGEDFVRTTSIARVSRQRVSLIFTSVFADRIAALLGLLLLALIAMPKHWTLLQSGGVQTRLLSTGMLVSALLALGGVTILACIPIPRLRAIVSPVLEHLPGGARMKEGFSHLEKVLLSRNLFISVIAGAIATQLLFCGLYYFCGKAVGVHAPLFTWCGFVPIILTANVIPLTVAGIGVRDYLLILFLGVISVDAPQAMAVSLLILAVSIFQCLSGLLSYLWFQPRLVAALESGTFAENANAFENDNEEPAVSPQTACTVSSALSASGDAHSH